MEKSQKKRMVKGVRYGDQGEVVKCVFCEIVAGRCPEGRKCVVNDGRVAVFESRTKSAEVHLLAVPVRHVRNLNHMGSNRDILSSLDLRSTLIPPSLLPSSLAVFHLPPFNSIDHLHLHLLAGPFRSPLDSLKHVPSSWKPWTISVTDSARYIERRSKKKGTKAEDEEDSKL